jgi:MFS family permease
MVRNDRRPTATPLVRLLLFVNLGGLMVFATNHVLAIALPLSIDAIGYGTTVIGLVVGAASLGALAFRFAAGALALRVGNRLTFVLGSSFFIAAPLLLLVGQALPALFLAGFLQGAGFALLNTTHIASVAQFAPAALQGRLLALAGTTMPISLAVTPHVTAEVIGAFSYRGSFLLAIGTAALALALFLLVPNLKVDGPRHALTSSGWWALVRRRSVLVPSVSVMALGLGDGVLLGFLPLFALERGFASFALFFTSYAVAIVVAQLVGGTAVDRFGAKRPAQLGLALFAASFVAIALTTSDAGFLLAAVACALCFGVANAALTYASVQEIAPQERGMALGVFYGSFDVGRIVGLALMGFIAALWGFQAMFIAVGAISILLSLSLRRYPSRVAPGAAPGVE